MRLNCTMQEKKWFSHGCRDTRSSPTVVYVLSCHRPTLGKVMMTKLLRPQTPKTPNNLSRSKPSLIVSSTKIDGRSLPNPKLQENLRVLDKLLARNDEESALNLVSSLRSNGVMKAFSGPNQIPKRAYSLEELRLNKIEPSQFLAPTDSTLGGVRTVTQGGLLLGLIAAYFSEAIAIDRLVQLAVVVAALTTADQILNAGGVEALLLDTAARIISPTYKRRVALHEAGHFLIAYLVGILPKSYTLSSWDAFISRRALNVQAGTTFCDSLFQKEVSSGKLTSSSLDKYTCVALAGVATEWLRFGRAEGGLSDVQQLDNLLRALRFTQAKADSEVRWAVLNVVSLLRRYQKVQDKLADAMIAEASVVECIAIIENEIDDQEHEQERRP